jgi:hypothetical protein
VDGGTPSAFRGLVHNIVVDEGEIMEDLHCKSSGQRTIHGAIERFRHEEQQGGANALALSPQHVLNRFVKDGGVPLGNDLRESLIDPSAEGRDVVRGGGWYD